MSGERHRLWAVFNDRSVEIQCDTDSIATELRRRLGHLLACSRPVAESLLQIAIAEFAPSCIELHDSAGRVARGNPEYVFHLARKWITAAFASAHPDHLWFHASAATLDGVAILLVGPSGAGKSTLVLRLVERGWRLLGDDAVAVQTADWTALPLPFTPDLRTATEVFEDDVQAFLEQPKMVMTVLDNQVAVAPASIETIVFPRYEPSRVGSPVFEPLPIVKALQSLAEQCAVQSLDRSRVLSEVFHLVRRVPCHRLLYGDAVTAAAEVTRRSLSGVRPQPNSHHASVNRAPASG